MDQQTNAPVRTVEQLNRVEALQNAVRHRLVTEDSDAIVRAAEKYFAFLQGTTAPKA